MHYHEILEENLWQVDFTKELLNLRADNLVIPGFDKNDDYKNLDLYAANNPILFYIFSLFVQY